jgi:signal transduction histidine kinase
MGEGEREVLEQRMALLLGVTSSLAAALTEEAVARAITQDGIAALGASYGGIWLVERERHQLRLLAVSPLPRGSAEPWTTIPLENDAPMPEAVRTNQAIYVDSLPEFQARYPASFDRIQETLSSTDVAYAMIPIADGGPPIGALAITYADAKGVSAWQRSVLQIVARQCALAFERIRLHEAERSARFDAEEAVRAREEILSVVSHDLRNPLGTILMGVSTLQQIVELGPEHPKAERIRTVAERIQRQSERMARQIEDLVDFAGIQAGKLSIERRTTAPSTIVEQTADIFGPIARERGVGFSIDLHERLPEIEIDPERGIQVLSNLITNALEVTAKGGRVTIGATDGAEVVFFVRDSGPGIDAAELPRLFERNWRSKKATYKGAGLGLSIARGIVAAHAGRIWAESQVVGATFFFTLTPRS